MNRQDKTSIFHFNNAKNLISQLDNLLERVDTPEIFRKAIERFIDDLKASYQSNYLEGYEATIGDFVREMKKNNIDFSQYLQGF